MPETPTLIPFDEAVLAGLRRLGVSVSRLATAIGLRCDCPVCLDKHPELSPEQFKAALADESIVDDPRFSRVPCECCGSRLAGHRFVSHGLASDRMCSCAIVHFEVCVDCVHYLANGDVPEHWEG